MKRSIELGTAVDSGTGDYLRRGGDKINNNFDEIYDSYGDGEDLTPATGGWITWTSSDGVLNAEFGKQYNLDTSGGQITVQMPTGDSSRFGDGIAFRDTKGTWFTNPVTFLAGGADNIDSEQEVIINVRFTDILMTYTTPASWRWRAGQRLDRFSDTAESSIFRRQYKVSVDGETDFENILPVEYNVDALDVYVNGHLLYYGGASDPDTQYGSYIDGQSGIIDLNGNNIRFTSGLSTGDIVSFVSFQKSIGTSPTSYVERSLRVYDDGSGQTAEDGKVVLKDLGASTIDLDISEFADSNTVEFQQEATEVYVNGNKLTRRGTGDLSAGTCTLSQYEDKTSCEVNGGTWTDEWTEYGLVSDPDGDFKTIRIDTSVLTSGDLVTFVTYNSIIGTILDINDILTDTNALYMRTTDTLTLSNRLEYSNPSDPSNDTAVVNGSSTQKRIAELQDLLDIMYPIGHVIMNAHNPSNPSDYMGFGTWVRYAKGKFIAGHDPDADNFGQYDPIFGENPEDLDVNGDPKITAGATIGEREVTLNASNIPRLETGSSNLFLKRNQDPDAGFLKYWGSAITNLNPIASYDEVQARVGTTNPDSFNIVPPGITTYVWVRVE